MQTHKHIHQTRPNGFFLFSVWICFVLIEIRIHSFKIEYNNETNSVMLLRRGFFFSRILVPPRITYKILDWQRHRDQFLVKLKCEPTTILIHKYKKWYKRKKNCCNSNEFYEIQFNFCSDFCLIKRKTWNIKDFEIKKNLTCRFFSSTAHVFRKFKQKETKQFPPFHLIFEFSFVVQSKKKHEISFERTKWLQKLEEKIKKKTER